MFQAEDEMRSSKRGAKAHTLYPLQGETISIRPLRIGDREVLPTWGRHDSPLFDGYNYADMGLAQRKFWYDTKKRARNQYFGVDLPDRRLIGYLGVKNINPIFRHGTLGIVFDPNYTSMGYGTEAMKLFLPHYFGHMRMRTMFLDVNAFNTRAIAMYENLGFREVGVDFERFENQSLDPDHPELLKWRDAFVWKGDTLFAKIIKMRMDRE